MEEVKKLLKERYNLVNEKKKEVERLDNALNFFKSNRTQKELLKATELLKEITTNLKTLEMKIESIDVKIVSMLEGLAFNGYKINVKIEERENEIGDSLKAKEIDISEDLENLWLLKTVKKVFNIPSSNINITKGE